MWKVDFGWVVASVFVCKCMRSLEVFLVGKGGGVVIIELFLDGLFFYVLFLWKCLGRVCWLVLSGGVDNLFGKIGKVLEK